MENHNGEFVQLISSVIFQESILSIVFIRWEWFRTLWL